MMLDGLILMKRKVFHQGGRSEAFWVLDSWMMEIVRLIGSIAITVFCFYFCYWSVVVNEEEIKAP